MNPLMESIRHGLMTIGQRQGEREVTMKVFVMTMISVFFLVGTVVSISHGEMLVATTLTGSTVEAIDSAGLNITIKTAGGGDRLSMPVASPEVMKGLMVGDRVSLELDLDGKVVKILKIAPTPKEAPEPRG
jgi:hypothetical protein